MTTDPKARLAELLDTSAPAWNASRDNPRRVTIRDAATMMVIDRTSAEPRILLGRRHHAHRFMPGKYVFPGGRVERADRRASAAGRLDSRVEARLMQATRHPSPEKARSFALAAIREVFEETGLALGTAASGTAVRDGGTGGAASGHGGAGAEWAKFAAMGVTPDLSAIHFIARAITPPGRNRRFDTRFFAIDAGAIAARVEGVVTADTELVELVWIQFDAIADLDTATVTRAMIEELRIRTAAGFGHGVPVPFYQARRGKRLRTLFP